MSDSVGIRLPGTMPEIGAWEHNVKANAKSYTAAFVLVVILVLWMASGLLKGDPESGQSATRPSTSNNESEQPRPSELMKVVVSEISPEQVSRELTLQGQLMPKRQLLIRSDTTGIVETLPVSKGTRVSKETLLVGLSLDGRDMRLSEAQALVKSALSEQSAAKKLRKQGLQSQLKLEQAQAALASTEALLASTQLDLNNTAIKSPFAGVVNALPVEIGQQLERGTVVAELIDDSSFRVSAAIAQQSVHLLNLGQPITAKVITGVELHGKVTFISAIADQNTRSFDIEAELDNPSSAIAAGVSASLIIPVETLEAVFVSPSAIALGDDGEIGIKTVNADNIVEFHQVELVRTTSDGAWITGVPPSSRLITVGQGFVNAGEEVLPVDSQHNSLGES